MELNLTGLIHWGFNVSLVIFHDRKIPGPAKKASLWVAFLSPQKKKTLSNHKLLPKKTECSRYLCLRLDQFDLAGKKFNLYVWTATKSNILYPGSLTVKRLDRRLDCLRTGVGVLVVGGTSIRSSFWLVLGVDGTEEE